jgi:hypothetical protein
VRPRLVEANDPAARAPADGGRGGELGALGFTARRRRAGLSSRAFRLPASVALGLLLGPAARAASPTASRWLGSNPSRPNVIEPSFRRPHASAIAEATAQRFTRRAASPEND